METITINYKELADALAQLEKDYPSRIYGHIDLLKANIRDHLTQFLSSDILAVELDDESAMAYIGGKPITGHVYAISDFDKNPTTSEEMYVQILKAKKEAERLGIYDKVFGAAGETKNMEDESILNKSSQENQAYLDELVVAVCINGDRLEKYEKIVIKRYGNETYANMKLFLEELKRSVERKRFTNTSKVNLNYLGKNAGLSEATVDRIVVYHEALINEDEYWDKCSGSKAGCQLYLKRYPNGKYAPMAHSAIADFEKKERELAREQSVWKSCLTIADFQNYLNKYPHGRYIAQAYDRISLLEKKDQEEKERLSRQRAEQVENEFWTNCKTNEDYENYLSRYPNGRFVSNAKSILTQRKAEQKKSAEENKKGKKKEIWILVIIWFVITMIAAIWQWVDSGFSWAALGGGALISAAILLGLFLLSFLY